MWDSPVPCKEVAECLKEVELKLENISIQEDVKITKEDVTKQLRKMPNWRAPGLDGIQGFWHKRLTNQYQRITEELNKNMQSLSILRTILIRKDPAIDNAVGN